MRTRALEMPVLMVQLLVRATVLLDKENNP